MESWSSWLRSVCATSTVVRDVLEMMLIHLVKRGSDNLGNTERQHLSMIAISWLLLNPTPLIMIIDIIHVVHSYYWNKYIQMIHVFTPKISLSVDFPSGQRYATPIARAPGSHAQKNQRGYDHLQLGHKRLSNCGEVAFGCGIVEGHDCHAEFANGHCFWAEFREDRWLLGW